MADYIERETLIRRLERNLNACNPGTFSEACYRDAIETAKNIPSADVVETVRCKDCEFSRELTKIEKRIWRDECRACGHPEASQDGYMIVFPEHFCSYGKRRDE